jgi:hypothetical protein
VTQEADRVQATNLDLIDTAIGATARPSILNLLHLPKTGGSSIWHTIADFSAVANPPLAYDYYHQAIKDQLPLNPTAAAVYFFCESGLLSDYHGEIYERHAASQVRFTETLGPTIADRRVLTHTHFPAPFSKLSEDTVTVCTTRESSSRFLSHAAHLLRELRRYQNAVIAGECAPDPLLNGFSGFPRNQSLLNFCRELAELRPGIATHQLRYILACLCSGNCMQSFEIMAEWSNQDVIEEFERSLDPIRQKTMTIRLGEDGQFFLSDKVQATMSAFGIGDFQVNRCVLETVTTPHELKGKANQLCELFRADRAFFGDLASEDALLRRLQGDGEDKVVFMRFRREGARCSRLWR